MPGGKPRVTATGLTVSAAMADFPSETSFRINGLGRAERVCAEKMDQLGIIPVDEGIYFLHAELFQMVHEFVNQQLADCLVPPYSGYCFRNGRI
jgi:hypothetical protein